jgi:hypothetical protein
MENSAVTGILQRLRPLAGWAMIGASWRYRPAVAPFPMRPPHIAATFHRVSTAARRRWSMPVRPWRKGGASPLPDQYYGAGCSTFNAVRLASLSGDNRSIFEPWPGHLSLANSFAGWARFGVDRAARAILGSPLVRIETMGSYSCRNVAGTEKRSAHATGNAIDVAAFVLANGRRVTVLNGWNSDDPAEREFLRTIHQSACRRFGTTLGPDFNAAHRNHLHVDLMNNGICH